MKVLFVLPRMVSGGVERVFLSLLKSILSEGHQCELALFRAYGELLDEAKSIVPVHELAPHGVYQAPPALSNVLQRFQPTHIVTAFHDVAVLVWLAIKLSRHQAKWIHSVHNTHSMAAALPGIYGTVKHWAFNRFAGFAYKHSDSVVTVSDGIRSEVLGLYHIKPSKVVTIYNPVITEVEILHGENLENKKSGPLLLVALGRLAYQKGFDILIEAMEKVPLPWRLDIWGEGPERRNLELLIAKKGLDQSIFIKGHTPIPNEKLNAADLFVLPSRHEGLPTVLIEALATGCQIVATDCPHGPSEILENGRLGTLVAPNDTEALAEAIYSTIQGKSWTDPRLLIQRAERFTVQAATENWLNLLQKQ